MGRRLLQIIIVLSITKSVLCDDNEIVDGERNREDFCLQKTDLTIIMEKGNQGTNLKNMATLFDVVTRFFRSPCVEGRIFNSLTKSFTIDGIKVLVTNFDLLN